METPVSLLPPAEQSDRKNNSVAIAAGVCGISSIVMELIGLGLAAAKLAGASLCTGIAGWAWLAGIVLGIVGLVQIRRHREQKGKGWAITGIVLGFLTICVVMVFTLTLLAPSIGTVSTRISATLTAP